MSSQSTKPRMLNNTAYTGIAIIFTALGLTSGGWGPVLPWLAERHGVDVATVGLMLFVFNAGAGIGIIGSQLLIKRKTVYWFLRVGILMFSIGFAGIVLTPTFFWSMTASVVAGFGFGVLDVGLLQAITRSVNSSGPRINLTNAFFAIGAVAGPFLVGVFSANRIPAIIVFTIVVASLAILLMPGLDWKVEVVVSDKKVSRDPKLIGLFTVAIGTYVGIEIAAGSWLPTMIQERSGSLEQGALTGALFYLMFAIGRLIGTPMAHRFSSEQMLLGSVYLSTPMLLGAILVPAISPYALAMMAMMLGPVFANASNWIAQKSPGDPMATTWLMLAAMAGALSLPTMTGYAMRAWGTESLPLVLAPMLIVSTACFTYLIRHWRTRS